MLKAMGFVSLLVTVGIVGYMAMNKSKNVPPVVNEVLPVESGEVPPADLKDVPSHVQKTLDKTMKKHGQAIEQNMDDQ